MKRSSENDYGQWKTQHAAPMALFSPPSILMETPLQDSGVQVGVPLLTVPGEAQGWGMGTLHAFFLHQPHLKLIAPVRELM